MFRGFYFRNEIFHKSETYCKTALGKVKEKEWRNCWLVWPLESQKCTETFNINKEKVPPWFMDFMIRKIHWHSPVSVSEAYYWRRRSQSTQTKWCFADYFSGDRVYSSTVNTEILKTFPTKFISCILGRYTINQILPFCPSAIREDLW